MNIKKDETNAEEVHFSGNERYRLQAMDRGVCKYSAVNLVIIILYLLITAELYVRISASDGMELRS